MYEYICKGCGKRVEVRIKEDVNAYCTKECYMLNNHKKSGLEEPIRRSANPTRYIHPSGYDRLVAAICQRAREDVLHNRPDSFVRQDAEWFFRSKYFAQLTNMDGKEILRKLHQIYNKKHGRKSQDEHGE